VFVVTVQGGIEPVRRTDRVRSVKLGAEG